MNGYAYTRVFVWVVVSSLKLSKTRNSGIGMIKGTTGQAENDKRSRESEKRSSVGCDTINSLIW